MITLVADFDESDGLGNFSEFGDDCDTQTRQTNAANEIQSISGSWATPDYDAAGNIIYGPKSGDETTGLHYVYDAWNRQVAVYEDDGDSTFEPSTDDALIAEHEYDGQKRRIEKVLDDSATDYFYNAQWQLVEERQSPIPNPQSLVSVNQYIWSQRYIDAPVVRLHDGNADGDVEDAGDSVRYYATDANFNVTTTITSVVGGGTTTQHIVYTAYGEAMVCEDDWDVIGAPTEDGPLYCGYFFDAETANYIARNRLYNVALATWLSRDPVEADVNLYRYCKNNPALLTDPFGFRGVMTAELEATIISDLASASGYSEAERIASFYVSMLAAQGIDVGVEWIISRFWKPDSCDKAWPGFVKCEDYPYSSAPSAVNLNLGSSYTTYQPKEALSCGNGGGWHYLVKNKKCKGKVGSVLCCNCCKETPDGPKLSYRCKYIPG